MSRGIKDLDDEIKEAAGMIYDFCEETGNCDICPLLKVLKCKPGNSPENWNLWLDEEEEEWTD